MTMSEVLEMYGSSDSFDEERERELLSGEQSVFFEQAFAEGADIRDGSHKKLDGPYFKDFKKIIDATDERIKQIDPNFTLEYLVPMQYQDDRIRNEIFFSGNQRRMYDIEELKNQKLRKLDLLGRQLCMASFEQKIDTGVLDETPYCLQADDWQNKENSKGCATACFRMVFGAITGTVPFQTPIATELVKRYGTSVVEDAVFSNVYATETFKEKYHKEVMTLEIVGANLDVIQKFASKIKARREDAQVFAVVNMGSKSASKDVWHTALLLDADGSQVTLHDPSNYNGGKSKKHTYGEFFTRWAVAYNRVQLFVVV